MQGMSKATHSFCVTQFLCYEKNMGVRLGVFLLGDLTAKKYPFSKHANTSLTLVLANQHR